MAVGLDQRGSQLPTTDVVNGATMPVCDALGALGVTTYASIWADNWLTKARLWCACAYRVCLRARERYAGAADIRDRWTSAANLYIASYFWAEDNFNATDAQLLEAYKINISAADRIAAEARAMARASDGNATNVVIHDPDVVTDEVACDARRQIATIDRQLAQGGLRADEEADLTTQRQQYATILAANPDAPCPEAEKSNWVWWAVGGTAAAAVIGTLVFALAPERKRKRAAQTAGAFG